MTESPNYIEVKEIESALNDLREKHQDTNTVRACLFNLVIYVKKDFREDYLQKIAKTIINKYPCRILVITEDENSDEEYLRAFVSDIMPSNNSGFFCDVINFEVAGSYRERIPFVVLPHVLAQSPVYLLWGDDPLKKDPISLKLEERATRAIFDSESSENLVDFAGMILKHQSKISCGIADLNWARFSAWRNLFANAFNHENKLNCIKDAKDIHITYNTRETKNFSHTNIQATYFQGWIAEKLGWEFNTVLGSGNEVCYNYRGDQGNISITLAPGTNSDLPPGRILATDIISYAEERITFVREKSDINKIGMHHCTTSTCEMPTHHMFNKEMMGKSMINEIYSQGTDPSFLKVLESLTNSKKGMVAK